jgi:outer membrane receptor protein involved in Fe transport
MNAYTLLDLQVGVQSTDHHWDARIWGKNIANAYYWNNVAKTSDDVVRVAGFPVTYGISFGYRF